jgi:hypothetical protein
MFSFPFSIFFHIGKTINISNHNNLHMSTHSVGRLPHWLQVQSTVPVECNTSAVATAIATVDGVGGGCSGGYSAGVGFH